MGVKPTTIQLLNDINQKFYQSVQTDFDKSRQTPWEGWNQILQYFPNKPLKILDVGCGNARFADFLIKNQVQVADYTGIDSNQFLLNQAKKKSFTFSAKIINRDIISSNDAFSFDQKFDLITLFGVMHHIPSFELRQNILNNLSQQLNPNGLLIFSAWQFLSIPSLKKRITKWKKIPEVEAVDLEENDYILDWQRGQHAFRYCHLISEQELGQILKTLQFTKVGQFYADGKNGKSNLYVVLERI